MRKLEVRVDGNRKAFVPGETLRVYVEWDLPSEPEWIELRLVWNTVGKGTPNVGVEKTEVLDSPGASGSRQMTLTLPLAPYSFSGTLISLVWALELVVLPSNESSRTEIVIAPGVVEVILQRVT